MRQYNLMQQALGAQWKQLPDSLRAHHQSGPNLDVGELDIEYPGAMQPLLNLLRLLGTLINRRGEAVPTRAEKDMRGRTQYWKRSTTFPDGRVIGFRSRWEHAGGNRIIDYVIPVFGLCMAVHVEDGRLLYEGECFVLRLGWVKLPMPEWLLLGHTTIVEQAVDDGRFATDFRLRHPLFRQIYRYAGVFRTDAR
jgi:hypothetical protein